MNNSSKKSVTQSSTEPWEGAQPSLKLGLNEADRLFKSDQNWQPYTGSTVVPFADQTMAGAGDIQNRAAGAMSGPNAFGEGFGFLGNMFNQGGLSSEQQGVRDQWGNTASGAELLNTSPEFEDVLSRSLQDARTGVDLSMSGAGRYGSPGAHQGTLARELGSLSSQARLGEYGRQLGRMDQSRMNLANLGQQGVANRFGATSALPDAWQAQGMPAQDMMNVGSMFEDLAGRTMADNLRIFEETRDAPMKAVEWLNAIGSGAGALGQSGTTTAQTPAPNPWVQAGAGLLGLNSLLGGF